MTGVRRGLRILGSAGLLVAGGVATNQVLNDGKLSWSWLYASLCVAVLSFLCSELGTTHPPAEGETTARGGRQVYLRQLRASVRDMETVGIATQSEFVFRMRQVYVDVSVVPQPPHTVSREPYLGAVSGGERRSLASVLRDAGQEDASNVLAVIGGPGSGKTTLARNTALELCEHRWHPWKCRLPVLLYLRDHATDLLADEPPALATVAVSAGWLEGKVSARWLERNLDRGGCVVLLDGLDEVADPAERGRVVAWVDRQIQRHPDNTYVVTSRPHGYESNRLSRAEVLLVRRFTWDQIDQFLRQWYYATESRARGGTGQHVRSAADRNAADLLARLRSQGALYDLAANPLLLTMMANVHRYRGQLPGSRAELYAEMCDVLLHRRSEARGLRDATGLTGPHKQHVAQHLALAMMKARVRDWPVREAARAIRRALRQVPGDVPGDVFLEEARKSGLLVEREHGEYGFAHLTLQEYLAAAQLSTPRADTGLLTGNVGDPWWRETILLWSAANDATPVITACLDRGTVPALALAFDCADQARTVEPETRDRLEALLAPPSTEEPTDPARLRLVLGILATRTFRDSVQLDETTALCTRPVPRALYDHFVRHEQAAGLYHPDPVDPAEAGADPAVGMQAGDAERFVDWINNITEDATFRLPSPAELSSAAAATVIADTRHTVWAQDGANTVLHRPPSVPQPFVFLADWRQWFPSGDRVQLTRYLRLLTVPGEEREWMESWIRALTAAVSRGPEMRDAPDLAPLELPFQLAVAFSLERALTTARARARAIALEVGRHETLLPDHEAQALADTLGQEFDHAQTLALIPPSALSQALDQVHANAPSHDPLQPLFGLLAGAMSRALIRAAELDPSLARFSDNTLTHAFNHAHGLNLSQALALARTTDPDLADRLDDIFDNAFPASPLVPGHEDEPHLKLAFALDLATDLVRNPHTEPPKLALSTFRLLLATTRTETPVAESLVLAKLDHLLASQSRSTTTPSDDPTISVRDALRALQATHDGIFGPLTVQAQALLREAADLLMAMRSRRVPSAPRTLSSVCFALLAAIEALTEEGHRRAVTHLRSAGHGLITSGQDATDQQHRNQILLLVRTLS
jgi:hypothetical protein